MSSPAPSRAAIATGSAAIYRAGQVLSAEDLKADRLQRIADGVGVSDGFLKLLAGWQIGVQTIADDERQALFGMGKGDRQAKRKDGRQQPQQSLHRRSPLASRVA